MTQYFPDFYSDSVAPNRYKASGQYMYDTILYIRTHSRPTHSIHYSLSYPAHFTETVSFQMYLTKKIKIIKNFDDDTKN